MLYLATANGPTICSAIDAGELGALLQPWSWKTGPDRPRSWQWAADNGCFAAAKWNAPRWESWLERMAPAAGSCLFATVPDVVGDAAATLDRWHVYAPVVRAYGYRPAFVGQDGLDLAEVPWPEVGAVFVGGSTEWKLSADAHRFTEEARARGLWRHMGRVNSARRLTIARSWGPDGLDSVDGTFLTFGPDVNLGRLRRYLATTDRTRTLFPLVDHTR